MLDKKNIVIVTW